MLGSMKLIATFALLILCHSAYCAKTNHRFTIQVNNLCEISLNEALVSMTVDQAVAGAQPEPVKASTTYNVSANRDNLKITACLNRNMPANSQLSGQMTAPTGGTTTGSLPLSTTNATLVTGIQHVCESNIDMGYQLNVDVAVGTGSISRTVTYTISSE